MKTANNSVTNIEARLRSPAEILPAALQPIQDLHAAVHQSGLPPEIAALVHLRTSQINGCSACVDAAARNARNAGETEDRLFAVSAWSEAPYFTPAERAALALAEAATRLSDRSNPVPDETWGAAARHFDQRALAGLVLMIGLSNFFNRINVTTRQVAGEQPWSGRQGAATRH